MFRTREQNKRLHMELQRNGIDRKTERGQEIYEDLVFKATGGRTKESSKMLIKECESVINHLNGKSSEKTKQFENTPANKMRRTVLSCCREMAGDWLKNGAYNWEHINGWCEKYGYLHKKLNDYTEVELPKLVTQFKELVKSHYAKK